MVHLAVAATNVAVVHDAKVAKVFAVCAHVAEFDRAIVWPLNDLATSVAVPLEYRFKSHSPLEHEPHHASTRPYPRREPRSSQR